MSGAAREHGVEPRTIEGVPVRTFSAAKTVADCFEFLNNIGLDIAIAALCDHCRKHRGRDSGSPSIATRSPARERCSSNERELSGASAISSPAQFEAPE
jgi:hypothetical protein